MARTTTTKPPFYCTLYFQVLVGIALGVAIGLGTSASLSARPVEHDALVTYHCSDLVVIGRFKNLNYEHVEDGDLFGHGWITARVRVRRVLFGRVEGRIVPVSYFAHTYLRDDRDFMVVINRSEPDGNVIRSAHLIDDKTRPRLARTCL